MLKEPQDQPPDPGDRITMLRALRERAGLTREQLISRMRNKISVSTLARWENRAMEPSMTREDWLCFCNAVGISWEELPLSLAALVEPHDLVVFQKNGFKSEKAETSTGSADQN